LILRCSVRSWVLERLSGSATSNALRTIVDPRFQTRQ
jgi:hypothetical protein